MVGLILHVTNNFVWLYQQERDCKCITYMYVSTCTIPNLQIIKEKQLVQLEWFRSKPDVL